MLPHDFRLGIFGGGVVGRATARAFAEWCEVCTYDTDPSRRTHSLEEVAGCDVVMCCLPTPQGLDGRLDTLAVDEFVSIMATHRESVPIIRSTVPIGYTRRKAQEYGLTDLCHSPEFLTARCSLLDAQTPSRLVVGAVFPQKEGVTVTISHGAQVLCNLYGRRWPHVAIHRLTSDESEAVKLIQNGFFAVKVAFWNEAYALCERLGFHWGTVLEAILSDGRIHPSHTQVPGHDGQRGFGGSCLPKDLSELSYTFIDQELVSLMAEAAIDVNSCVREDR